MTRARALLAALLAGAVLLAGGGCGSEEEEPGPGIPRAAADQLTRELDLVQERIDVTRERSAPGACNDVQSKSYPDIQRILDALPDDTDPEVRRALERSIDRLKELADSECSELVQEIEEREEETPAPLPTTPPAPVQPPQTTPEPTETKPKERKPKPKDEEKKPEEPEQDGQDKGDGGAGPNGQGPPGQGGGGQPAPPAGEG